METKLDKLSDAIVSLARMEERMVTVFKRMDSIDAQFKKMDGRIAKEELAGVKRGHTLAFAERLFWVAVTAIAGCIFLVE